MANGLRNDRGCLPAIGGSWYMEKKTKHDPVKLSSMVVLRGTSHYCLDDRLDLQTLAVFLMVVELG